jgi:hypothetical protein
MDVLNDPPASSDSKISRYGIIVTAVVWRRSSTSSVFIVRPSVKLCLEFPVFRATLLHQKQVMTHLRKMNVSVMSNLSLCSHEMNISQREAVVQGWRSAPRSVAAAREWQRPRGPTRKPTSPRSLFPIFPSTSFGRNNRSAAYSSRGGRRSFFLFPVPPQLRRPVSAKE